MLLREVNVNVPFSDPVKWNAVAKALNAALNPEKAITSRTVRERTQRLMDKHRADKLQSVKKSGTNEEYGERELLLTEILQLEKEAEIKIHENKIKNKDDVKTLSKTKEDTKGGKFIRKRAMESLTQISDDSDGDNGGELKQPKKERKRKEDPFLEMMRAKLDLEAKREERLERKLQERAKERQERNELMKMLMEYKR
ncbi:DNA ligase 1-like isoform X1 [Gigantopelta aegis]|uniref:DNA ligase 1-like isoform X1 n=1 Tax=Gigantopelta aegis TaxID=1735272 RepID=UPI001B88AA4C|nr:DNA ligase 1-like isoform X1 [Gigantopelta aegis]XP_041375519.1 DNA ligase 1-like isoform X1 [Gigantopelta aegis]